MAWWDVFRSSRPLPQVHPAAAESLTAAAAPVVAPSSPYLQKTRTWQEESWRFFDELGEYNYGVTWLANMMSQVRLRAGKLSPGLDEPEVVNTGIAAELISNLSGGVGGQAQMMRSLTIQMSVPGDCYLIGEQDGSSYSWQVRSTDEVRAQSGKFQTVTSRTPHIVWTDLPPDALPVRIWRPHARWFHIADSPSKSALSIMQELDLVNRHILAQYLSRLASAGIIVMPDEVTLPTRPEFDDADDPFVTEWVQIAADAIRTPGTASAVVPIPLRVPAEFADKFNHLDFTLKIDEKIIEKRDSAITRLATKLDIPTEVLTGLGKVNHWTAWQLDEGALKTHIAPLAELVCHNLTVGYLQPRLQASNAEDAGDWVVWYDMSELALRPDLSTNAIAAYDRMELSGEAFRREIGFSEDDAPEGDDLRDQGLKILIRTVANAAPAALDELVGEDVLEVPAAAPPVSGVAPGPAEPKAEKPPGTPDTKEVPPSATPEKAAAQILARHAIRFDLHGSDLMHPPLCADHAYTCPFTHASKDILAHPDTPGVYECRLDPFGRLVIGGPVPMMDTDRWITTAGRRNGHARS